MLPPRVQMIAYWPDPGARCPGFNVGDFDLLIVTISDQ
jgi:hypothetical protein